MHIKKTIRDLITASAEAGPGLGRNWPLRPCPPSKWRRPNTPEHGDLAANLALVLAKQAKTAAPEGGRSHHRPPRGPGGHAPEGGDRRARVHQLFYRRRLLVPGDRGNSPAGSGLRHVGLLGVALPRRHRRRRRERHRAGLHRRGGARADAGTARFPPAAGDRRRHLRRLLGVNDVIAARGRLARGPVLVRRAGVALDVLDRGRSRRSSTASAPSSCRNLRGTSSRAAGRRMRRRS